MELNNHLTTNVGVYVLLIKDRKLLLLHQPNNPIWYALGGRMNSDEVSLQDDLIREVFKEIKCDIRIGDVFDVVLWSVNGKKQRLGIFYICYLADENSKIEISDEHDDYKFMTHKELVEQSYAETRGEAGRVLFNKLKEKGFID